LRRANILADFENPAMLAPAGVGRRHRHVAVDDPVVKERDAGERATGDGAPAASNARHSVRCYPSYLLRVAALRFRSVSRDD
jgi:hypothetical protein